MSPEAIAIDIFNYQLLLYYCHVGAVTGTCSRPFFINNFNPTINVLYDILVGLKLLITKGREQVPVVQSKFELIFTYNKATSSSNNFPLATL
jgi:hypothetical protein